MSNLQLTPDQINKLKSLVNDGIAVKSEQQVLREGLSEAVKAVAKEMDIKPAIINRAINVAYKSELGKQREELDDLETILVSINRDL